MEEPDRPVVFLSSTFKDDFGFGLINLGLRKRILENEGALPIRLWAYEHIWHQERPAECLLDADTIIDRCFAGIKTCDLFVFVVTGRHGSGAGFVVDNVTASYLELELFAAAVLKKPILVLHYKGREPEPALSDAMFLLKRAFASSSYVVDNENALFTRFRDVCHEIARGGVIEGGDAAAAALPEGLSLRRTRHHLKTDLAYPRLLFLDGKLRSGKRDLNVDKAKTLIEEVAVGERGEGTARRFIPHGAALFRLWAAMRELMDDKQLVLGDPSIASLWDRALGLWAAKASWFGLHGHLWLGPLAAVNSQIDLRRRIADEPEFHPVQDVREPLGARASALYSIAQRMRTRRRKLFHYRQVVAAATQAADLDPDARQGVLSIRAHALMRMGMLGYVWNLRGAAADLEQSLSLRISSGASRTSIGEALADLGFVLVLTGRFRKGLAMLHEGVALMRHDESPDDKAFLARGLRKLHHAARLCCRRDIAAAAKQELAEVANSVEAIDQIRG